MRSPTEKEKIENYNLLNSTLIGGCTIVSDSNYIAIIELFYKIVREVEGKGEPK